jgi:hypothetical protein
MLLAAGELVTAHNQSAFGPATVALHKGIPTGSSVLRTSLNWRRSGR